MKRTGQKKSKVRIKRAQCDQLSQIQKGTHQNEILYKNLKRDFRNLPFIHVETNSSSNH